MIKHVRTLLQSLRGAVCGGMTLLLAATMIVHAQNYITFSVPGAQYTEPYGISSTNIVGWYSGTNGYYYGFLYNGSSFTTLSVSGDEDTYAQGIDGTNIVGYTYLTAPAVQIDPPNGLLIGQASSTLTLNNITTNNVGNYFVVVTDILGSVTSSVASLTIVYDYAPSISRQPQSVNVAEGSNTAFNVAAGGFPPFEYQWWMVSGVRSNATAVPFVTNGFVLAANITSGGAGYLSVPTVQIVGGSGSGAGGYAVVSNLMVTAITMTNAGFGYTSPPQIQITPPSAVSLFGQTSTNLILDAVNAGDDGDYFVAVTNNYGSVTSAVAALTVFLPPQGFNFSAGNSGEIWHSGLSLYAANGHEPGATD